METKATESFRVHKDSDCHKDYSDMTEFSETNQNVNESLDETSVNEKLKNCQIFVTILHNTQFLAFRGN